MAAVGGGTSREKKGNMPSVGQTFITVIPKRFHSAGVESKSLCKLIACL